MIRNRNNEARKRGFTLVEIMIVVVIIGILAALAVPAFQRARWNAIETSIKNNLRQIWGAAQQYMMEKAVPSCELDDIIVYESTKGTAPTGTNPGYTGVIKMIADENYANIIVTADGVASPTTGTIYDTTKTISVTASGGGGVSKTVTLSI